MRRLPLQTLPTFVAVAQGASVRAAAERLHLTHSAISQQIRLLEEQLGFEVFDRRGRRVVLNAAGQTLLAAVAPALAAMDAGVQAATVSASAGVQRVRISVLPSFARQWLLPRMAGWRALHPQLILELNASLQLADLNRDGFHAALRFGRGPWSGLDGICLMDSPSFVVVGAPQVHERLATCTVADLANEALIGHADRWEHWFELAGHRCKVHPVAVFNDAGLMLQAAEQGLGIALSRDVLAADALCAGRLKRLSPLALQAQDEASYWLVYPAELSAWPPLAALRAWLQRELEASARQLKALFAGDATAPPIAMDMQQSGK